MIFMVFLTITLAAIVVATAWSAVKDAERADADGDAAEQAVPVPVPVRGVPETLEGVLARQLLDGEITGPQYRRVVHKLAERDAARHPLSVPSDD